MFVGFRSLFTPAYSTPHLTWVPEAPDVEPAPTVAVGPIEHTLRNVDKAITAMVRERDDLDQQIRIMSERVRQLTVSSDALEKAAVTLSKASASIPALEEIANAKGA
jgi:hypothetical protein